MLFTDLPERAIALTRRTARHEVGHAVVALEFGFAVERLEFEGSYFYLAGSPVCVVPGETTTSAGLVPASDDEGSRRAAIVALAGMQAVRLAEGEPPWNDRWAPDEVGDVSRALQHLDIQFAEGPVPPEDMQRVAAALQPIAVAARDILQRHASAVESAVSAFLGATVVHASASDRFTWSAELRPEAIAVSRDP